ncbi:phage head closure protein [Liquorilactobacillus hordei]|uniref:phage head closure protein n=1 Tax=Liquorilactobacillus hordei TaxID=468911 RepID=UPI0039E7F17D
MSQVKQSQLTNRLKWTASLLSLKNTVDEDDRPIQGWGMVRNIFYEDLGITSTEKYLAVQAKTDVVKRIRIRYDSKITQKNNRIKVDGVNYKITRIYADKDNGYEELSLNYVD